MAEQHVMTTEQLRQLIIELDPNNQPVDDDMLIWFICRQEASAFSDYNTREIAEIIRDGIKPKTIDDVQEWLDMFFEDNQDEDGVNFTWAKNILVNLVKRFNGVVDDTDEE